MVDVSSRKTYEKNGLKTIVDNEGILWLHEKYIEEGLDHKNLRQSRVKYLSDHTKHRYEREDEKKNNRTEFF